MIRIFSILYLVFTVYSCKQNENDFTSYAPVDIELIRYEQLLFDSVKTPQELIEEYPGFSNILINQIITPVNKAEFGSEANVLKAFSMIPQVSKLYDTTSLIIGDLTEVERNLGQAMGNLTSLFADQNVPQFITYISEFGVGVFNYEDQVVGIGLDFFLGKDFPYPDPSLFPYYIKRSMNKDHIVRRVIQVILEDRVPYPTNDRMIDLMVRNGKVLYLLEKSIGFEPDSVIFNAPSEKLQWMRDNEVDMWTFLLGENLLYETNFMKIQKYIGPAPHSPGMPDEAPGETANFIGYKIISKLMSSGEVSIEEMLSMEDGQEILERARYKPR